MTLIKKGQSLKNSILESNLNTSNALITRGDATSHLSKKFVFLYTMPANYVYLHVCIHINNLFVLSFHSVSRALFEEILKSDLENTFHETTFDDVETGEEEPELLYESSCSHDSDSDDSIIKDETLLQELFYMNNKVRSYNLFLTFAILPCRL